MTLRWYIILLFSALFPCGLSGQPFHISQITTREGLPSNTVYDFAQDELGYLWMGTGNGVCRFDGKFFRHFSIEDGLPNNVAPQVTFDPRGRLWINSMANIPAYIFRDSVFKPHLPELLYRDIVQSTTQKRLFFYIKNVRLTELQVSVDTLKDFFGNLNYPYGQPHFYDQQYYLPWKCDTFLLLQAGKFEKYPLQCKTPTKWKFEKCVQQEETFICLSENTTPRLWRIDLKKRESAPIQAKWLKNLSSDRINHFFLDRQQRLWLGTSKGLFLIEKPIEASSKSHSFLTGIFVNRIFQDKNDNIWVGTEGEGIFRLTSPAVESLQPEIDGQPLTIHTARIDSEGNIYLGSGNGHLLIYAPDQTLLASCKLGNERIMDLLVLPKKLWVATSSHILEVSKKGEVRSKIKANPPVKSINQSNDTLYIFSRSAHKLYEQKLEKMTDLGHRAYANTFLNDSTILLGTTGGLFQLDLLHDTVSPFLPQQISIDTRSVKWGRDGNCWIATTGKGIFCVKNGKVIRQITKKDGLPSNICKDVLPLGDTLWIATNSGLARHLLSQRQTEVFGAAEGMPDVEVSKILKRNGNLLALSSKYLYFFPTDLSLKKEVPNLHFTRIRVNGTSIPLDKNLELPPSAKDLNLSFNGIALRKREELLFSYRMEGLEENWLATRSLSVNYPGIRSGNYRFLLRAKTPHGPWTAPLELSINIAPPFWQRSWFVIAATLLGLFIAWLIYLLIWNILHRRHEEKQRLLKYQLTALRTRMNPHFLFNAFSSIQEFINRNDPLSANYYLSQFSSLIRSILQQSTEESITLENEIEQLKLYLELEKMRIGESFEYQIRTDKNLDTSWIRIPNMIIQPFIENALIHGLFHKDGLKRLDVFFSRAAPQELLCTITDNGIGREEARRIQQERRPYKKKKSMGISTARQRLQLLKDHHHPGVGLEVIDLKDQENGQPLGTRVRLTIPF